MTSPLFIIAEAGVNHGGDVDRACRLVREAALCGADAVKFQTFRADALVTADAPCAAYQQRQAGGAVTQRAMLRALELDEAAHHRLRVAADEAGIEFLSTPYDEASADLLERVGVARYKLASGDLTHLELQRHVAGKGRPMIVSTGMASLDEVAAAVSAAKDVGNDDLTLLHCTSAYPADPADANLRALTTLAERFGLPVGYSDHTVGNATACAAVALGARVVEKHFTLDRDLPGPDHRASIEPEELARLVADLREVASALGSGEKGPQAAEQEARALARRGLWPARSLEAGRVLAAEDLVVRRPARGLAASALEGVLGRRLRTRLDTHDPLREEHLA